MRGRTIVDLSLYKAQIITWFQDENKTAQEIVDLLCESYDTTVTLRTVQRRLKDWNITKRTRAENTATLQARIAYMFCILGFTDLEILHALKHEGYRIEMTSLVRIR
jgi:Clr5 domain